MHVDIEVDKEVDKVGVDIVGVGYNTAQLHAGADVYDALRVLGNSYTLGCWKKTKIRVSGKHK